jgi:tetratricopeptide (TPR) repeat protein
MGRFVNLISNAWLVRGLLVAALAGASGLPVLASDLPEIQRLVERRDFRSALVKVNQHLGQRPDSLEGRFYKGVILAESYETPQAIAIFSQLIKDAPQMLEAYNNLAVLYARQQDYDQARATLEAAVKVDPAFSAVASNLRNTYGRLAKQAYDKALGQEAQNAVGGKNLVMLSQLRMPSSVPDKTSDLAAVKSASPVVQPAPVPSTAPAPVPAAAPAVVASVTAGTTMPAAAPKKPVEVEPSKPAAPETKVQPTPAAREREVRQAVEAWAGAWMRKDMKAYLNAYASDFKLPGKLSRSDWERQRTQRIKGRKDSIQITLGKFDIEVKSTTATVSFLQRYKSGSLVESTNKTLTLVLQDGKWRIKSEK